MKGITTAGRVIRVAAILLSLLANPQSLHAAHNQIIIVKSSDNAYFNQTIEALINNAGDHSHFKVIDANALEQGNDVLQKANIIITLGEKPARIVSGSSPNQLVINAYITLEQAEQLRHPNQNQFSVLLNQPIGRYLAFSQQLLNLNFLGIINRSNLVLNNKQEKIRRKLNLVLNQYQPDSKNKRLLAKVRQLTRENDALLMLPDQSIYNRDTLRGILLTAYRSRTSVISYSPAHVKSGALAAIYSSPKNIGQHLANLVNLHNRGKLNNSKKLIFAEYYSIAINPRIARALGLDLLAEEKLRQSIDEAVK